MRVSIGSLTCIKFIPELLQADTHICQELHIRGVFRVFHLLIPVLGFDFVNDWQRTPLPYRSMAPRPTEAIELAAAGYPG